MNKGKLIPGICKVWLYDNPIYCYLRANDQSTETNNMILPVLKKHLLLVNAVIWGLPGAMILLKGVKAYVALQPVAWWMYLVSLVVFVLFALMFSKIVRKYSDRTAGLEGDRRSVFDAFSIKGYILITSMILLGVALKFIPGIPTAFFATFYCGLGPGLLLAMLLFIRNWLES